MAQARSACAMKLHTRDERRRREDDVCGMEQMQSACSIPPDM
jgi:hypothetical protein